MVQAGHDSLGSRVGDGHKDNRDDLRCLLRIQGLSRQQGHDDVNRELDELTYSEVMRDQAICERHQCSGLLRQSCTRNMMVWPST